MCYDVATYLTTRQIEEYFPGLIIEPLIENSPEPQSHLLAQAFPQTSAIVYENDSYRLKNFEWGVVTEYMDTSQKVQEFRRSHCNATMEKLLYDKRSFWYRIRKKRCLIPVTGFYEHRTVKGFKNKIPYFIWVKDRPFFCLPAVYHYNPLMANLETGLITETFSIITRPANKVMAKIHNSGFNKNRMPVLFNNSEQEKQWLQPDLSAEDMEALLQYELPEDKIECHTVYKIRGSSVRPDGRKKFEVFEYPGLQSSGVGELNTDQQELF